MMRLVIALQKRGISLKTRGLEMSRSILLIECFTDVDASAERPKLVRLSFPPLQSAFTAKRIDFFSLRELRVDFQIILRLES